MSNTELNELVSNSIPPSKYVRSTVSDWCNVAKCKKCSLKGYDSYGSGLNRLNPCPNCGSRSIEDAVGRWVNLSKWWMFWDDKGYWEILNEK